MIRWMCLTVATLGNAVCHAAPGVVEDRPASGRYVEAGAEYLVAYQTRIPGSRVTFWMEPIPGGEVTLNGETFELAPYWMGRTEVTWAEYRLYMNLCASFERLEDAGVRRVTDANRIDAVTAPSKILRSRIHLRLGRRP